MLMTYTSNGSTMVTGGDTVWKEPPYHDVMTLKYPVRNPVIVFAKDKGYGH